MPEASLLQRLLGMVKRGTLKPSSPPADLLDAWKSANRDGLVALIGDHDCVLTAKAREMLAQLGIEPAPLAWPHTPLRAGSENVFRNAKARFALTPRRNLRYYQEVEWLTSLPLPGEPFGVIIHDAKARQDQHDVGHQYYLPTEDDIAIVKAFYPNGDAENPSWTQIETDLVLAGMNKMELCQHSATTLIRLLPARRPLRDKMILDTHITEEFKGFAREFDHDQDGTQRHIADGLDVGIRFLLEKRKSLRCGKPEALEVIHDAILSWRHYRKYTKFAEDAAIESGNIEQGRLTDYNVCRAMNIKRLNDENCAMAVAILKVLGRELGLGVDELTMTDGEGVIYQIEVILQKRTNQKVLVHGDDKSTKRRGGRPRLEARYPLKFQVYERIRKEHKANSPYHTTLSIVKQDNDFVQQVKDANLKLNSKLVKNAIAFFSQVEMRASKQQTSST